MTSTPSDSIETIVADIRGLRGAIEDLITRFRQSIPRAEEEQHTMVRQSAAYWTRVAYADSLVRVRLFLEQNFSYIESMGLLAVTRYLFELIVWLKLMQKDNRYGLVYYRQLIKDQLAYYEALREHLNREIIFFKDTDKQEEKLTEERMREAIQIPDEDTRKQVMKQVVPSVMKEIDQRTKRRFSIYGQQARTNGYGFQAHLIETKVLPDVTKAIAELERERTVFENEVPQNIKILVPKRWNWKDQAKYVGMEDEYNFIYSYASKLLHATPASLTTNQKNLEPNELMVFLKYVNVRLLDIIQMATQLVTATGTY